MQDLYHQPYVSLFWGFGSSDVAVLGMVAGGDRDGDDEDDAAAVDDIFCFDYHRSRNNYQYNSLGRLVIASIALFTRTLDHVCINIL